MAQASSEATLASGQTRYLLPDGSILPIAKWDSLEKAWGKGKIALGHNEEDDKQGIVHLVRLTEETTQEQDKKDKEINKIFAAMLDKPAPDFALQDMQGKQWSLKDLRGKIVVLNFWFTSCAPCIQEMPDLNKLTKTYSGKDVVFLALTFNDSKKVETFLNKRKFDFVILPNSRDADEQYNVHSWPTSIVIDKAGNIKKIFQSNPKVGEEIRTAIESSMVVR